MVQRLLQSLDICARWLLFLKEDGIGRAKDNASNSSIHYEIGARGYHVWKIF